MFKVDKCVLISSLLIIKQGKYRKLKDEIDDFDFDDVVLQCLKSLLIQLTERRASEHLGKFFFFCYC